jgi:capsular exopolysaccharide synthesis family protein
MDPGPLELRDYLSILWRRKWTIIAVVVTTIAVALIYSFRQTPVYTSSAEVIVLPTSFNPGVSSAEATAPNMVKEEQVANSAPVEQKASLRLKELDVTRGTMLVSQVEDADTLVFTSVAPDPRAAQATASAYANAYLNLRRSYLIAELRAAREPYESRIEAIGVELDEIAVALGTAEGVERDLLNVRQTILLSDRISFRTKLNELATPENVQVGRVLRSAERPGSPSGPDHTRNGLLALVVGSALGIGVALLRDRLDDRIRGREVLEHLLRAPVLAFIPWAQPLRRRMLVTATSPGSMLTEAFGGLGVRLLHAIGPRTSVVLITSSHPDEGKTSVVANLGVTLADTGKSVVIVSADLRKPRLQDYFPGSDFGPSGGAGLTELLSGKRNLLDTLTSGGIDNLRILHAGGRSDPPGPSRPLGSPKMSALLAELRDVADIVLIDTPPLLQSSDVTSIAALTDGVLFVVDPYLARRSVVEQARRELQLIGVPVLGVVVNKHESRRFRAYGSGHIYLDSEGQPDETPSMTLRAISGDSERETPVTRGDSGAGHVLRP